MKIAAIRPPLARKVRATYLLAALALLGPRLTNLLWWLLDPVRWRLAFNGGIFLPLVGCLVLPWTTLLYVLLAVPDGLIGRDWIWLGVALLLDLFLYDRGIWGSPNAGNLDRISVFSEATLHPRLTDDIEPT
jgi:hypothetical protein